MQKRVRAIIIENNRILAIKRTKPEGVFWVFPGGGVEEGETNEKALLREAKEELGLNIHVRGLFCKKESKVEKTFGQREYFYVCEISGGKLGTGDGPEFQKDSSYVGKYNVGWIDISNLKNIDLRPSEIKDLICKKYL